MLDRLRATNVILFIVAANVAWAAASSEARGEDTYWDIRVVDMKFAEGKLPAAEDPAKLQSDPWQMHRALRPYAVLDDEGEAYVDLWWALNPVWPPHARPGADQAILAMRFPNPGKVSGSLFWPKTDCSGMVKLRFTIDSRPQVDYHDAKTAFNRAKQSHYWELMNRGITGGAWFRHQYRVAEHTRDLPSGDPAAVRPRRAGIDSLDGTFDLLSGGRAVSENLQLDRALPAAKSDDDRVPLGEIKGIAVAEIDWKPLLRGVEPKLDALAKLVPADQHVALFPSFQAFVAIADRIAKKGAIVLQLAAPQALDGQLAARYERQLGVSIDGLGRVVGPQVIGGVAITGSDPYFQSGTDFALVFESAQPGILKTLLLAQIAANARKTPGARPIAGELGGLSYSGLRSDDRAVSSYVAALSGAVLLTNSPHQVERFAAVANHKAPAIASLDEFVFFRNRYPLGEAEESALVFLSDATIRRWCGPRWRIGASRELRDAAVLAELQAEYMDRLVKKQVETGPLHTDLPLSAGGDLTLGPSGPRSSTLGDLEFMTPIAELEFDQVSRTEAEAYERWRDGYQRNWRWAFDPIALRLSVAEQRLAADLTVMPLIAGSEYRRWIAVSRGATIGPDAGDRHDALVQAVLAINGKSETIRSWGGIFEDFHIEGVAPEPLSWLGESISISMDRDPFWKEYGRCETDGERWEFTNENFDRMPVGIWVEVSDGLKLIAFLGLVRKLLDQVEPGMTKWEARDYRGEPYVRITPTDRAWPLAVAPGDKYQLLYAASGKYLCLTPSEAMLKRFLDRQLAGRADEPGAGPVPAASDPAQAKTKDAPLAERSERRRQPWLGSNVALQVDRGILPLLTVLYGQQQQSRMRIQSWNNLPILNEWRRLYPDRDPLEIQASVWHEKLVCPGGGKYVWNDEWQTMESTAYGHPGQPKPGPDAVPSAIMSLLDYSFANFGLSFEEHGLRARVSLDRTQPKKDASKEPER